MKKNHGKKVSKYFLNDVECGKVFGVTRFYGIFRVEIWPASRYSQGGDMASLQVYQGRRIGQLPGTERVYMGCLQV